MWLLYLPYAFIGSMGNVIKKPGRTRTRPLTINVSDDYKEKYDRLSVERKVRVSEHLRQVVYPELDRLWLAEMGDADPAA